MVTNIFFKQTKLIINNFTNKKAPNPNDFDKFNEIFKKEMQATSCNFFQKLETEGTLSTLSKESWNGFNKFTQSQL